MAWYAAKYFERNAIPKAKDALVTNIGLLGDNDCTRIYCTITFVDFYRMKRTMHVIKQGKKLDSSAAAVLSITLEDCLVNTSACIVAEIREQKVPKICL